MIKNKPIAKAKIVSELISTKLSIPEYQRPYSWRQKQIFQLLDDLKDAMDSKKNSYLIGTIIVYKPDDTKEEFEIVDGQQRLTTISIILFILNYPNSGINQQLYNHVESQNNIKLNYKLIKEWIDKKEIDFATFLKFILNNVCFVFIEAPSQDEAFVFFDSQNSRGKPLEKYDLLKAHHLRYISDSNEIVAKDCTVFWEKIDKSKKLSFLIYTLLGRTRIWSRKEYGEVDILHEFKSQRISNNPDGFYKLNRYQQPPVFDKWRYIDREIHDVDDGLELIYRDIDAWQGTKRIKFISDSKKFLPFQIMQPLEGGEQFFWFIEKYNQLHTELFNYENENIPKLFQKLHRTLTALSYNLGISYIIEVFEASCLFYYDKFGNDRLLEFSICLEHQLSILRFNKVSVQYASIDKFIREGDNVFAIINEAAFPEHIIRKILMKTEGRYKSIMASEIEKGIRKVFFENLYGENGYYTVNNKQLENYLVMKSKDKFKANLQS